MAALIQYEFDRPEQYKFAGEPMLVDTADEIVVLGKHPVTGKFHVEVLFADLNTVPNNGLLNVKAADPIPHEFIGYPTLEEFENS